MNDYHKELELTGEQTLDDGQWLLSHLKVTDQNDTKELLKLARSMEGALENGRLDLTQLIREMEALVEE